MKKAFTLAELMVVLTVIGVLAGILVPVANNARPDEKIMKFKKAYNTLGNVIRMLTENEELYCKNGDLGLKPDCTTIIGNTDTNRTYFCRTFADAVSAKSVNCKADESGTGVQGTILLSNEYIANVASTRKYDNSVGRYYVQRSVDNDKILATKKKFDTNCRTNAPRMGNEIVTTDGITYYQAGVAQFGSNHVDGVTPDLRYHTPLDQIGRYANYCDQDGYDIAYKILCIDIDGIPADATLTDCKNECPFGVGVRNDGKMLAGERADEWIKKSFQKGGK